MRKTLIILAFVMFSLCNISAQNDVMMQAFYWDVPVDAVNKNGSWWDTLAYKAKAMGLAGFKGLWVPPPAKGNFGIYDMGYGLFDHYDLGNYNQKGTTETRFGSRTELNRMIDSLHRNGIHVYADIILNHIYTGDSESESNPAVKQYVFDEAYRNGTQYQSYPTNEIIWKIPNAQPGDYYIQIKGYLLNWSAASTQRGYDVMIDWTGGTSALTSWESEPNNGSGQFNVFPGSARTVRAHIGSQSDIDEYKITLTSAHDIVIKLIARKEGTDANGNWEWQWADQCNGYYPRNIWYNGQNLGNSTLQARTNTAVTPVNHTGTGEANFTWNYTHFHPVDNNDWLGFPGSDEIITNTKFFGNDLNTFNSTVKTRLKNWGYWLANTVGFDGFRLDFVRGFQESFVAEWVNNLPLLGGSQRFIVGEYWGADYRIKNWVNTVATNGADVDGFDFPLKNTLKDLCNGNQSSFNMAWLNHAGLVRNNSGNNLPGTSVVTFVDNHDTGKEHDKWVTKDYKMAYAYLLTHEGRPCVFYPHYYGVTQTDAHNSAYTVTAPASLRNDINKLIKVRKNYLGGSLTVLSETGNPYPSGDTYNVYVARRQGNGTKSGAIIVINNHDSNTKGLWVDSSPSGYANWANTTLVNALDPNETTTVQADGRVYVTAPARGYKIWVKQSEYISLAKTLEFEESVLEEEMPLSFSVSPNFPNPFNPETTLSFFIPGDGKVAINIYNSLGQKIDTLLDEIINKGDHKIKWNATKYSSGAYYYQIIWNNKIKTGSMLLVK